MDDQNVLKVLTMVGAVIKDSHIVYTSGKHGSAYINKDALYADAFATARLCEEMAERFADHGIEVVAAPALGGIILSQWVGYFLTDMGNKKVLSVYAEKETERAGVSLFTATGNFIFGRGYGDIVCDKRVLVVEDVLTTGGSASKVIQAVERSGGKVAGVGVLVNRGEVTLEDLGLTRHHRFVALLTMKMEMWDEASCPLCRDGIPVNTEVGKGREYLERKKKT